MRTLVLAALLAAASTGSTFAQDAKTTKQPNGQPYLESPSGMALYVFDGDRTPGGSPAASTCYDKCAQLWPPFIADANAAAHGDWSVSTRKEGALQWVYKGRPLYTFVRDTTPGKIEGDGFNGNTWHLAKP